MWGSACSYTPRSRPSCSTFTELEIERGDMEVTLAVELNKNLNQIVGRVNEI